jgi:hypothetical protein
MQLFFALVDNGPFFTTRYAAALEREETRQVGLEFARAPASMWSGAALFLFSIPFCTPARHSDSVKFNNL